MADSLAIRPHKQRLRSLRQLDQRTIAARQARDLERAIVSDLGGDDHLSALQRQLAQRAAVLFAFIAHCEAAWLACDGNVPIAEWMSAVDRARRLAETLGLQRALKPIPSLAEYLASLPPENLTSSAPAKGDATNATRLQENQA